MKFSFLIPKRLPGLNEVISASGKIVKHLSHGKKRVYRYTIMKKELCEYVEKCIIMQSGGHAGLSLVFKKAKIHFLWIEDNRRRDPDNICAGGRKFILDGMVKSGLIENDNWNISDFSDTFIVDKKASGVQVEIIAL